MAALAPEALAALVLQGEFLARPAADGTDWGPTSPYPPAEPLLQLQESRWDAATRSRSLAPIGPSRRGAPLHAHPFAAIPAKAPLDRSELTHLLPDLHQTPTDAQAIARELLALLEGPRSTTEALQALHPLETRLQELTHASLAWECYRIELNGLLLADLAAHRHLRAELLRRMLPQPAQGSP